VNFLPATGNAKQYRTAITGSEPGSINYAPDYSFSLCAPTPPPPCGGDRLPRPGIAHYQRQLRSPPNHQRCIDIGMVPITTLNATKAPSSAALARNVLAARALLRRETTIHLDHRARRLFRFRHDHLPKQTKSAIE
jgi:hypothetical protein